MSSGANPRFVTQRHSMTPNGNISFGTMWQTPRKISLGFRILRSICRIDHLMGLGFWLQWQWKKAPILFSPPMSNLRMRNWIEKALPALLVNGGCYSVAPSCPVTREPLAKLAPIGIPMHRAMIVSYNKIDFESF